MNFPSRSEIDLHTPRFVEVIGVTEDRLVFICGMDCTDDDLVMLAVVTGLDEWLRIDIEVRRAIHKSNREQIRLFCEQSEFRAKNPLIRLEAAKHRDLGPLGQTEFGL
jgi:hypothetical protein